MQSHMSSARRRRLAVALACAAIAPLGPATTATADEPEAITIEASGSTLTYGDELTMRGTVSPERDGHTVRLRYRPAGGDYETVEETTTDEDGGYRFELVPEHSGELKAVAVDPSRDDDVASDSVAIDVAATLTARANEHTLRGDPVTIQGRVRPGEAGRKVVIQQRKRGDWESVSSAATDPDGGYATAWEPGRGSYRLRARFGGDELNGGARQRVDHRVNVYRSSVSSWYGPGLYGNRTACGQRLRRRTVGVAHKTLQCGTNVRFYYRGRTATVPVIDRGPFVAGREWDLTEAAKDELRFPDTDEIWSTK